VALSAAAGSFGDFISHFTGIRMRITGSGTMRPSMMSQDDIITYPLAPITLSSTSRFHSFTLANVIEQRAHLQLKTTEINDDFAINRIILFGKTMFTQVPA
jgi:hypothetical protein